MKPFLQILLIVSLVSLHGQTLYEKQIIPFDMMPSDRFGRCVSLTEKFLFISSLRYEDLTQGCVYVYKKTNNDYVFDTKIFPNDPENYALFGSSLLYANGLLFVGAQNKRVNNFAKGALYIFKFENNQWIQKQKILPPDSCSYGSCFSNKLFAINNYLFVSAFRANVGNVQAAGKVFIYKLIDKQYVLQQELYPPDAIEMQFFGSSICVKEDVVFVGSEIDSTSSGEGSGSIYNFIKIDSFWIYNKKYIPEPNSQNLALGSSMAANDSFVFVGTADNYYYNKPGQVYIYGFENKQLELRQIINSGDNYFNDRFGITLAVIGDTLLIGALEDTVKNKTPGCVYLFVKKRDNWLRINKIIPSDEENAHDFGNSISCNNEIFVIGAMSSKVNTIFPGKVYLFSSKPLSMLEKDFLEKNELSLSQNYPNPFNSTTRISYSIPQDGKIIIKVFDGLGQEIKIITEEIKVKGNYYFDVTLNNQPSGIYFYRLEFVSEEDSKNRIVITQKTILIK
jgi:hypothetical protein